MDLELNDDQRLLKEMVERLMADRVGFEARRAQAARPEGRDPEIWALFAELGLLATPFAEADGGVGGGAVEVGVVMEALGGALALEPYLSCVVLAGGLLAEGAAPALRAEELPPLIAGERLLALAHGERAARYNLDAVATTARRDGAGWRLAGEKSLVLGGDDADALIVSARDPEDAAEAGVSVFSLFLVEADAPGVSRRGYALQDDRRAAEIRLEDVPVDDARRIGPVGGGGPLIARAYDRAIAAQASEAVGAMAAALELTTDYLRQRRQFGRPIGEFQVLQHRAVDMFVALEQARSMALFAAMALDEPDAAARGRAVSAAHVRIARSARFVGQNAVQLHGGVGVTMEYAVGHYFKRLSLIERLFGDVDHHLARAAQAPLLDERRRPYSDF